MHKLAPYVLSTLVLAACGGGTTGASSDRQPGAGTDAGPGSSHDAAPTTTLFGDSSTSTPGDGAPPIPGTITATIRDFPFYDGTSNTNPDFENPPYGIDDNGNPSSGYQGSWDDKDIVADTLGADGEPVYKNPTGTTLTTHGKTFFDMWFHDTPGFNDHVDFPLPLTASTSSTGATQYGYDSEVSGVVYTPGDPSSGNGFFPIDDGTTYGRPSQVTFGNQALTNPPYSTPYPDPTSSNHNYSFTLELHTVFTYQGGEVFDFRGDDDVFVFIDQKLVINLGGVHSAEPATVSVDSLGLTVGSTYPLDFFSVERHVVGSNIEFSTTLALMPIVK